MKKSKKVLKNESPDRKQRTDASNKNSNFHIFDKLRELYVELSAEDADFQHTSLGRKTSFLLDKLVAKENLNTLILNLYPGNKGYSLAFKGDVEVLDVGNHMMDCNPQTRKALAAPKEKIQETIRWPYEEEDLLECIDNETLPLVLVDLFQTKCPNLFYCGCVIVEVRDYRQSFPIYTCDTYHVLLRPTNQTLLADVNSLTSQGQWTHEEKLALESQLVLATAEPLCLDPNPAIGIHVINSQHQRRMFNTKDIRRKTKKFTQVSINRKRKTDQFTHHYGLDLYDYMSRFRQRSRHMKASSTTTSSNALSSSSFTNSMAFRLHQQQKKTSDGVTAVQQPPVPSPYLGFPPLQPPAEVNVNKFARAYERPKETKDCMPQLIEEYILETEHLETNQRRRLYYIKLSIFQRPANNEYLGKLYVDKDYRENVRNGEACSFTLGTRANANKYIQQFTEIITEEGRLRVKITHLVPGQPPRVTCTVGVQEQPQVNHRQETINQYPPAFSDAVEQNSAPQPSAPVPTPAAQHLTNPTPSGSIMVFQQQGGVSNFLPIRQNILPSEMGVQIQRTQQVVPIAAKPNLTNPTINAIVTNLISSEPPATVQGDLTYGSSPSKSSNNSTIINLLNSAPAAMNISNVNSFLSPPAYKELTGATEVVEGKVKPAPKVAPVTKEPIGLQQHIKLQTHPIPSTLVSQLVSPPLTVTTAEELKRQAASGTAVAIAGNATLKRQPQQQLLIAGSACNKISLKPQGNCQPQKISTKLSFPVTELTGLLAAAPATQEIHTLAQQPNQASVAFAQPKQFTNLHQSLQSPPAATPLASSPSTLPQQTTTTLNLQGISLSSLQNAMATIPGTFQNVQIQIPGLAQSLSLPLGGGAGTTFATATSQATGLLVNTVHSGTLNNIPGSGTQTVVLTNSATDSGASMLSLPLAATASTSGQTVTNAAPSIQLLSTLMQSGVPLSLAPAATATVKQKPIIISEQQPVVQQKQQVLNSVKKIATTSNALHANAIQQAGINAGQLVLPAQNFQLKFHKQPPAATFDASGGSQAQMVVSPVAQGVVPKTDEQPAVQPTFEEIYPNL
ncbi:transcription factor SPT20 homolog isoform X2 [Phlebotomus papatasi]|uniref:transcription factor SPT20 homolog isoform X2 n=1 Tax=Phlebotomus papatasi TaxID=29031 RepID=UPI002483CF37|nr:transcription factor SPT20 homolog isoform X2 [Phlebotomus papatasi]